MMRPAEGLPRRPLVEPGSPASLRAMQEGHIRHMQNTNQTTGRQLSMRQAQICMGLLSAGEAANLRYGHDLDLQAQHGRAEDQANLHPPSLLCDADGQNEGGVEAGA